MSGETRTYTKKARATAEEATRQRITEAAIDLHGSIGPARTSISAIAERAGVRRSTVYRHFADEAAIFDACSAHWNAQNPPPDLSEALALHDPAERTQTVPPGRPEAPPLQPPADHPQTVLGELARPSRRAHAQPETCLREEPISA